MCWLQLGQAVSVCEYGECHKQLHCPSSALSIDVHSPTAALPVSIGGVLTHASFLTDMHLQIDFDSATQAPLNGYSNVDEYYLEMSPVRHTARLAACQCPTLSVTALDDPIIHADTMLETAHMTQKNPNLFVLASKFGGHCGWPVGNRHSNMCEVGFSFMNQAILQFCESAISVGDIR